MFISLEPAPLQGNIETLQKHVLSDHRTISPSLNVIKTYGASIIDLNKNSQNEFRSIRKLKPTIITSHQDKPRRYKRMFDRNPLTRWSPSIGEQKGTEWILIALNAQYLISGIEISTGNFKSDFPRGIKIEVAENCDVENNLTDIKFKTHYDIKEWYGAVAYTKHGYPYFAGQNDLKFRFPLPLLSQCILIEQIGKDRYFDWSVAEINIDCGDCKNVG